MWVLGIDLIQFIRHKLLGNKHFYLLSYLAGTLDFSLFFFNTCFKKALKAGLVACDCNPNTWESEASLNWREVLCFKKKKRKSKTQREKVQSGRF